MSPPRLRVKVISSTPTSTWLHQFPHNEPVWGDCEFVFDRAEQNYDWLLVYDDLPARPDETKRISREPLYCPREHTLLVTTEPSSVKIYGDDYTRQFGAVLTSQPAWALPHRQRIYAQPALHWFYGVGRQTTLPFDEILAQTADGKQHDVSMVHSNKAMRHTLHYHRARFMHELARLMPEIETFGRHSARALDDKADCLRAHRYHIAIENYLGAHHWTEKLADPFLGLTLPFYCGCPDLEAYFPRESFIRIDLLDPQGAINTIRQAIANHEFEKRLPAIIEARRRVLFEYNLFAVVAREISCRHRANAKPQVGTVMLSRRAMRLSNPLTLMRDLYGKLYGRLRHLPGAFSGKS
jgi:hypothetical protein